MQIFFFFEMPFEEDPKARSLGALLDTQHLQILQNLGVFFNGVHPQVSKIICRSKPGIFLIVFKHMLWIKNTQEQQ